MRSITNVFSKQRTSLPARSSWLETGWEAWIRPLAFCPATPYRTWTLLSRWWEGPRVWRFLWIVWAKLKANQLDFVLEVASKDANDSPIGLSTRSIMLKMTASLGGISLGSHVICLKQTLWASGPSSILFPGSPKPTKPLLWEFIQKSTNRVE